MTPTQIHPHGEREILIAWDCGERFTLPYTELRYQCPCAACVDEATGHRTIRREAVRSDVRPKDVRVVGRYAVQFTWSDGHGTGMYPFDLLHAVCVSSGHKL